MNAPKVISLLAFAGYAIWSIWFGLFEYEFSRDLRVAFEFAIYAGLNLAYYFFLRKRGRENRVPKYATSIALLLALVPLTGFPDLILSYLLPDQLLPDFLRYN